MADIKDVQRRHELKTWPSYFHAVNYGLKPFEVRLNDRDYQVGDILSLVYFDPTYKEFGFDEKGNKLRIDKRVSYVLSGGQFGIEPGYVVMGLTDV